nr:hypothetical protein [Paenibacillus xylanexedens]
MVEDINVPIQIIKMGFTEEYVALKRDVKVYEDQLWELCQEQENLVREALKQLDNLRHVFSKYTYSYDKFKERKEWMQSLVVQEMTNEIVNQQGGIQELVAKQVDIAEKLNDMSKRCIVT